ncbi:MAG: hypothetical protein JWM20_964 [Patescibacteria group bacterium]|nr:hypothetical protein [Patescibacteria group bacterium]
MKSFKTISVAVLAALALLVSVHFAHAAWTVPTGVPPTGNVTAPVNVGATGQVKTGPFTVLNLFMAKQGIFGPQIASVSSTTNIFSAMSAVLGGHGIWIDQAGNPTVQGTQLNINLTQNSAGAGRNAIDIEVSPDNTAVDKHAAFTTNAPGFHFWSNATASSGGILAGYITLNRGCQANGGVDCTGKILTSDANGNASWEDASAIAPLPTLTGGTMDIKIVRAINNASGYRAFASCAAGTQSSDTSGENIPSSGGYTLVGGGGDCADSTMLISQPNAGNIHNEWQVSCVGHLGVDVHSTAVCMKYVAPTLAAPTAPVVTTQWSAPSGYSPNTGNGSYGYGCSFFGTHSYGVRQHNSSGDQFIQNSCLYRIRPGTQGTQQCQYGSVTNTNANLQPVSSCTESSSSTTYTLYRN